jgi:YgiT-type zinc finger domain-containing protein
MCKGSTLNELSTFTTDMEGCVIVIKKVPSFVCEQCGEISYNGEVARRLEQIVKSITIATAEVAVVSYSEKAA